MKQQETDTEARLAKIIANGGQNTTQAVMGYEHHVAQSTAQLAQSTEASSNKTTKMMTDFTTSVSSILAKHDKVYKDATASIESVAEVVEEHELSIYEPTGESPAKRDRLDTSAILQVENDAEIRARFVPSRDTTMNESNQVTISLFPRKVKSYVTLGNRGRKCLPKVNGRVRRFCRGQTAAPFNSIGKL